MTRIRLESLRSITRPQIEGRIAPRTDDDLVQSAQSGDHEAFAELCRRHAQVARRRVSAIVRHEEDVEDVMQETLLRAYVNLRTFRQSCKFSTWITAIGVNAALSVIRKRKSRRESQIETSSPDELAWDIADKAPSPESRVAKAQIIHLLREELHDLSPLMQEAVIIYYVHGSSLEESAAELGISIAAIKSRLLRGRRHLRVSLERQGLADAQIL